jgi:hypothetical protein
MGDKDKSTRVPAAKANHNYNRLLGMPFALAVAHSGTAGTPRDGCTRLRHNDVQESIGQRYNPYVCMRLPEVSDRPDSSEATAAERVQIWPRLCGLRWGQSAGPRLDAGHILPFD